MLGRMLPVVAGLCLLAASFSAEAEPRVALVIGNSNYGSDIGKLTNPVNDAALMGNGKRFGYISGVVQRNIEGQRSVQGFAFDVLHHQVVRAHVVERGNEWVIQSRYCACLSREPLTEPLAGDFDRDKAIQARISRLVHFPHAASP